MKRAPLLVVLGLLAVALIVPFAGGELGFGSGAGPGASPSGVAAGVAGRASDSATPAPTGPVTTTDAATPSASASAPATAPADPTPTAIAQLATSDRHDQGDREEGKDDEQRSAFHRPESDTGRRNAPSGRADGA